MALALIDLLVDLKEKEAAPALRKLVEDSAIDSSVRDRAKIALGKLQ